MSDLPDIDYILQRRPKEQIDNRVSESDWSKWILEKLRTEGAEKPEQEAECHR